MNLLPDESAKLAEDLGLTIHVQPVTTAPVLDGVISTNEYPTTRTLNVADIFQGNGSGEIQGETITEYFGHDGEYVYYAATFTQSSDNRAFWPQFKCDNTFDIYNSNYNARATYQARYSWGPDANGVDHHINYVNGIGAQAGYDAPVDGVDLTFAALKDRETNVKTYEFRFAKNYFATQNGISYDEVEVIPYYSYFHAACATAPVLTDEQVQMILDAGKVAPAANAANYYFMVLEGETTKIEDRITINTIDAASVRISAVAPGLRFKSTVDTFDLYTLVTKFGAENVQIGTLIAPATIGTLTHASGTVGTHYIDVKATVADPFGTSGADTIFAGSISNIKAANLERDFVAVGYICINGTYIYSATSCTRNVTAIVNAALADEAANPGTYSEYQLGILNQILNPTAN